MSDLLANAYDIHLHFGPDTVPRAQTAWEVACDARAAGMAGLGLKDHGGSTATLAHNLSQALDDELDCVGTLTLNESVGGLNPYAVETALKAGARIVWFPTMSARRHFQVWGRSDRYPMPGGDYGGLTVFTDDGRRLRDEVLAILDLLAQYDACLASGHLGPDEVAALFTEAASRGVQRRMVTHSSEEVSATPLDLQQDLAAAGALIEHCFLATTPPCPGNIPLETLAEDIRALGAEHVVLSSDFGQIPNGPVVAGFEAKLRGLLELGFTESEVRRMIVDNPRRLVVHG